MKKEELMNKMSQSIKATNFQIKKYSPEILVGLGIIGTIVSGVIACKATTKIGEVLEKSKSDIDKIHDCMADEGIPEDEYSEQDGKKDLVIVYTQTGIILAKLYAPAIILGTLSITSILASTNMLRKRNVALAAAYATVDKGFKEYRDRVIERYGEDAEHQIRYNLKSETMEETVVDENGKSKKVKSKIQVSDGEDSAYLRYFTSSNPYWDDAAEYTEFFIHAQENYANDRLRTAKSGFVTLNTIYEALGFEPTKDGMVVGWRYCPENKDGDNYIRFNVQNVWLKNEDDSYERAYAIDFNADGNIFELL